MKFLTTEWVAEALGVKTSEQKALSQISSDTREITKGSLFVALKGENTDGHKFVDKALSAGAIALVHEKKFKCPPGLISFPVSNTLDAWRLLARAWRREFQIPIVAVAGSAGKTTSKELLAALFSGKWNKVLKTEGSQNGFQGVPTTLLRLRPEHEVAVIEVGIDDQGAMIQHLDLVNPTAGILTSIGPEHLEKLIDLDTVEKEEGLLFKVLEQNKALACINVDDERIRKQGAQIKTAKKITYGIKQRGDVRARLVNLGEELWMDVEGISSSGSRFKVPLEGAHNALNLLGAIALSYGLGLSRDQMQRGLATFVAPPGRSEVHQWKGCKVLADTYNANPASVTAALETLFSTKTSGQTWVCLGDMLELGALEETLHRSLAQPISKFGVKHVMLYGARMKHLEDELKQKKFKGSVKHFSKHEEMAKALEKAVKPGDRILIKGSRGMRMENVWDALKEK